MLSDAGAGLWPAYKTNKRSELLNVPASFDIETTSWTDETSRQHATMYVWQLGLNGSIMMGRTWDEFTDVCSRLSEVLDLSPERRLVIYVHNLAFEFQWIRKRFDWHAVFAVSERTPVYAITESGIEFRCSYILSGYGLALLATQLKTFRVPKLVGDLDYRQLRHSGTPLTQDEINYCVNDVLVVMSYIYDRIQTDGNITKIKLTMTGYVRSYCRDRCLYGNRDHKKGTWKTLEYRRRMSGLTIDPDEYKQLKRAFAGGFTHASAGWSGLTADSVHSFDFTSSYPAVMVSERFPVSSATLVDVMTEEELHHYLDMYCCVFDVEFIGLCERPNVPDHPLSSSKCWNKHEVIEDNDRVVSADSVATTITDVDFRIFEKFYVWDGLRIGKFRIYRRGYLPTDFIDAILELYKNKTSLKGVTNEEMPNAEDLYASSKSMLNACYGMTVTDICQNETTYKDGTWSSEAPDLEDALNRYNTDKKRFLFYPWGVFVTAYARRNLFTAIYELGDDYIYSDTDSVKFRHLETHTEYFESYNTELTRKMARAMRFHKFDPARTAPLTKKGKPKALGDWDYEGMYKRFKTLGAKRYMVETDRGISITVSGVNKTAAVPFLCTGWYYDLDGTEHNSPFSRFSDHLIIPPDYTGKLTHTYIDDEDHGELVDMFGNVRSFSEQSSVHLMPASYEMSLAMAYISYLLGIRERSK